MRRFILFLILFSLSNAAITAHLVDINKTNTDLVYDDHSSSYFDAGENPNIYLYICGDNPAEITNKYIMLVYANGNNGDYFELAQFPQQIVPGVINGSCAFFDLYYSSFLANYPAEPYLLISDSPDMNNPQFIKLDEKMLGSYSVSVNDLGTSVSVTINGIKDDNGNNINDEVDRALVALVSNGNVLDSARTHLGGSVVLSKNNGNSIKLYINGIYIQDINASSNPPNPPSPGGSSGGGSGGSGGGGGAAILPKVAKYVNEEGSYLAFSDVYIYKNKNPCKKIESDNDLKEFLTLNNVWCPDLDSYICEDSKTTDKIKYMWEYSESDNGKYLTLHIYSTDDFIEEYVLAEKIGSSFESNKQHSIIGDKIYITSKGKNEIILTYNLTNTTVNYKNPFANLPSFDVFVLKHNACSKKEIKNIDLEIVAPEKILLGNVLKTKILVKNKGKQISGTLVLYIDGNKIELNTTEIPANTTKEFLFNHSTFNCSTNPANYIYLSQPSLVLRAVFLYNNKITTKTKSVLFRYPDYIISTSYKDGNIVICSFLKDDNVSNMEEHLYILSKNKSKIYKEDIDLIKRKHQLFYKKIEKNRDLNVFYSLIPTEGLKEDEYLIRGEIYSKSEKLYSSETLQKITEQKPPIELLSFILLVLIILLILYMYMKSRKKGKIVKNERKYKFRRRR